MLVSNTSTLVLLAKVGCLERFITMSPPIVIPRQVKSEAFAKESYDARLIDKLITAGKIVVKDAETQKTAQIMTQFRLDIGEAAAYALSVRQSRFQFLF